MKVIHHARVPIIKAQATDGCGTDMFNIDISIDGPTHSGLATSAFTSYLSDHLPNLAPLTIVLKSLLQVFCNTCRACIRCLLFGIRLLFLPADSEAVNSQTPLPFCPSLSEQRPERCLDRRYFRVLFGAHGRVRSSAERPLSSLPRGVQLRPTVKSHPNGEAS